MNKVEFIKILEKKLACISHIEREEIITEYSQNIEDKILYGINEEAAVAGFGNPADLARELISTYKADRLFFVQSIQNRFQFYTKRMKCTIDTCLGKCKDMIHSEKKEETQKAEREIGYHTHFYTGTGNTTKIARSGMRHMGRGLKMVSATIFKCMYGLLLTALAIPFLFYVLFLGVGIVLTCLQYPTAGISILLVGCVLISGTILASVWRKRFALICTILSVGGILLIGVGSAVTFAEITDLEMTTYERSGAHVIYKDSVQTTREEVAVYTHYNMKTEVIADKSLPIGEIHIHAENDTGAEIRAYLIEENGQIADLYYSVYDNQEWIPMYISEALEAIRVGELLTPQEMNERIEVQITAHPDMQIYIR